MKNYFYLYKTTNLINHKIYIGIHKTKNLDDGYLGSGSLLKKAIKKYGKCNFKKEIIKFFETEDEMFTAEKELVTASFTKQTNVYNINPGGVGGFKIINGLSCGIYGKNGTSGYGLENLITGKQQKEKLIKEGKWESHKEKISFILKQKYESGYLNPMLGKKT